MEALSLDFLETLPTWIQVAVILSVAVVGAKVIEAVGYYALHRSRWLARGEYDRIIIEEVHLPLYVTVFLVGVYASAQLLPGVTVGFYIATAALTAIVLVWAYALVQLEKRIIGAVQRSDRPWKMAPVVTNVLTFFIVVATFFVILGTWQVDVTPFLASAGIIGIIIGIAAQESIGNFFSGISLYLDETYKIGDVIQLESGERGTVIDMSMRSTTILTRDNITIAIPNSEINGNQLINESAPVRRRRIRLDVGVAYGSDLREVEEAILEVADAEELVLESPAPVVRFREFADSAIRAQLQCHIERPEYRGRAWHALIKRIDERFDERDIKIPFPQQEVTFFESDNAIRLEGVEQSAVGEPGDGGLVDGGGDSSADGIVDRDHD